MDDINLVKFDKKWKCISVKNIWKEKEDIQMNGKIFWNAEIKMTEILDLYEIVHSVDFMDRHELWEGKWEYLDRQCTAPDSSSDECQ